MLTSSVKTQFKPCRIYTANLDVTKKWYVYYDFLIPGTQNAWKRFKLIHDINRIKNREDRLAEANNLKKFMNEKLQAGYNPFTDSFTTTGTTIQRSTLRIEQQLQIIYDEQIKGASKDKVNSLKEHFNRFMKFINEKNLRAFSMGEFSDEMGDEYRN